MSNTEAYRSNNETATIHNEVDKLLGPDVADILIPHNFGTYGQLQQYDLCTA